MFLCFSIYSPIMLLEQWEWLYHKLASEIIIWRAVLSSGSDRICFEAFEELLDGMVTKICSTVDHSWYPLGDHSTCHLEARRETDDERSCIQGDWLHNYRHMHNYPPLSSEEHNVTLTLLCTCALSMRILSCAAIQHWSCWCSALHGLSNLSS